MLLVIPVLYLAHHLLLKFTGFTYLYIYAISLLATILFSLLFDKNLLSSKRIITEDIFRLDVIKIFLTPLFFSLALYLVNKFLLKYPLIYILYSSNHRVHGPEFVVVYLLIILPITEILFRGFFQFNLSIMIGEKSGYILASLIQTMFFIFLGNYWLVAEYLIISLYLGFFYYKYRSIVINVLIQGILAVFMLIFPF